MADSTEKTWPVSPELPPEAGPAPGADVREVLARAVDFTAAEVIDLLGGDQVRRWRRGERVPAEAYLLLHPALPSAHPDAFELVYNEFLLREEQGQVPALAEFLWRFPQFADRLRRQVGFHRALADADEPPPDRDDDTPPDGRPAPAPASVLPRPSVAGYEIRAELGRGGMGVVYLAWQTSLKRPVALKMIRDGILADAFARDRFRREAEAAARLQHPHIVQVYEVGEQDGQPFIALEYVEGGSLAQQTQGQPQPPAEAAALLETLARTVHHAHQAGIVHRDLKPANILLAFSREPQASADDIRQDPSALARGSRLNDVTPKITDFGLAKQLDPAAAPATQSGAVVGTPRYMAPEQAAGRGREVGPAVDLYALGAILYELLTGRPPFAADNPMDTLFQVLHNEPVSVRRLQPKVPRDLETICLKCLAKEPRQRYASTLALADDLKRFRAGESIHARPAGAGERAVKWARRRPALTALLAVSLAATVGLVAGGVWYNTRLQGEVARRKAQQERATASLQTAIDVLENQLNELWSASLHGEDVPGPLRQGLLEHALQLYPKLLAGGDDPEPLARRAVGRAYFGLGLSHEMLGQREPAGADYRRAVACQERLLADFPDDVDYRIDLATTLLKWAYLLDRTPRLPEAQAMRSRLAALVESLPPDHPRLADLSAIVAQKLALEGRLREALPWLDRHIAKIEADARRLADRPGGTQQHTQRVLQSMYVVRAQLSGALGEHRQALADWDRALAVSDGPAMSWSPAAVRTQRALTLARLGDAEHATREIDEAIGPTLREAGPLYTAAAVYAQAAALAHQDARQSVAERASRSERYASGAVAFLRRCQAAGYFDQPAERESLKSDRDLDPLRSRHDFQRLLEQLRMDK